MNQLVRPKKIGASACPHDCPSTCALEVDVIDPHTIGRLRGAADNSYTAGVICEARNRIQISRYSFSSSSARYFSSDSGVCRTEVGRMAS